MAPFIVNPTYPQGSWVYFATARDQSGLDVRIRIGKIIGIRVWQPAGFMKDKYMLYYIVVPKEFVNFECNEDIEIPECHINECFPRIIGLAT